MEKIRDITHAYAEALDAEKFPVWEDEENSTKKKERIFDHFWTLEDQQTILGLLKGKKMKKKLKEEKEKNV